MRRVARRRHDVRPRWRLAVLCADALATLGRSAQGRPNLLRDRRGVTALVFAASAIVIIGFVGLATEGGVWYLVRREAQNTADASAIAAALSANDAILAGTDPATPSVAAGTTLATTNGFSAGANSLGNVTVTVNYPPSSGTHTGTAGAVEVIVSDAVTPLISGLFGGKETTVGARSVAMVEPLNVSACALSLTGDLTVSGTVNAGSCALASNASDSTAINVTGALTALTVTAVGGFSGTATLTKPAAPYHPPTPNPYIAADAIAFGTFSGGTCATAPAPVGGIIQMTAQAPGFAYCTDINLAAGDTLQFTPGTYIFYNASLIANAGTIQCQFCNSTSPATGVSIVFLGTGTLTIGPNAVVSTINAPSTNATYPALNGILFYGRGISPVSISLLSPSPAPMDGGVYFPNAALAFTGNATNPSVCLSLVTAAMTLYSTFSLAPSGCSGFGTILAQLWGARIVE